MALTEADRLRPIGLPQDDAVVGAGALADVEHQQPSAVGREVLRTGRSDPRQVALGLLAGHARAHAHRHIFADRQPSPIRRDVEDDEPGGDAEYLFGRRAAGGPDGHGLQQRRRRGIAREHEGGTVGRPGQPLHAKKLRGQGGHLPAAVDDFDPAAIVEAHLVFHECDAAAVGRHAGIAQVAAGFVERRAGGELQAIAAVAQVVHDRHRGPVRRPVGLPDVFRNGTRRAADGHARQRAAVEALIEEPRGHDDGQLTLARDREQVRVRLPERLWRFGRRIDDEELRRRSARRRAVDDRLAIGHEPRVGDRQAIERAGLEAHDAGSSRRGLSHRRRTDGDTAQDGGAQREPAATAASPPARRPASMADVEADIASRANAMSLAD